MTLQPEVETARGDFEKESAINTKNPFKALVLFIKQVLAELRKVVTPTGRELFVYTLAVIVFVVIMIGLVFGLDFVFGTLARVAFTKA